MGEGRAILKPSFSRLGPSACQSNLLVKRVRTFAVAAALLSVLSCSTPNPQPSHDVFDEVMHKSGLWAQLAQIEPLMQLGVTRTHEQEATLSDAELAQLRQGIATTYAADGLRTAVRDRLAATLTVQDAADTLRWLASDLGQRITALEEAGANPDETLKRLQTGPQLLANLPASRGEQLQRLAKATFSAEAAATIIVDTMIGVTRGLAASGPGVAENIEDQESQDQLMREHMAEMLGPRIVADFAAIYRSLSDEELEQYVTFCESPTGHKFAQASLDAIDNALTAAAVQLGRRLAGQSARHRNPDAESALMEPRRTTDKGLANQSTARVGL